VVNCAKPVYERHLYVYAAFFHLACLLITLRRL
jgi:hypothetical protein